MQLPTAADLVRAFIADLSNVLDVGAFGGGKPTVHKTLWCTGSASITPDRDYTIVGVKALQIGLWCLSVTGETAASIGLANGTIRDVVAAVTTTTWLPETIPMRWVWRAGQKLILTSSAGIGILLVLEP